MGEQNMEACPNAAALCSLGCYFCVALCYFCYTVLLLLVIQIVSLDMAYSRTELLDIRQSCALIPHRYPDSGDIPTEIAQEPPP